jgi:hypothetical protein
LSPSNSRAAMRLPYCTTRQLVAAWITGAILSAAVSLSYSRWEARRTGAIDAELALSKNAASAMMIGGSDIGMTVFRDSMLATSMRAQNRALAQVFELEADRKRFRPIARALVWVIAVGLLLLTWRWARPVPQSAKHDAPA